MKIYDCFMFFNELDLLEIRLNILSPYVDYFVLVESTTTHSGKEKPLLYQENRDRFKEFNHKIIHIPITIDQKPLGDWDRENFQREHIHFGLKECCDDDIIMVSDLDEIPNLEGVDLEKSVKEHGSITFQMALHYYFLNVKYPIDWSGTFVVPYSSIKGMSSLSKLRLENRFPKISNGWHFSYMGGLDSVKYKIESYAHQEFNNDTIKENLEKAMIENKDPFGRGDEFMMVEIDETYPKYILDNLDKYNHLIKK
jgi:beta-1,4-mannosyl-glycoprotein beta-1,4-N-acetylglucosaminyltransferase